MTPPERPHTQTGGPLSPDAAAFLASDAPFRSDTAFLAPPQRPGELGWLAHYRVLREVGAGGMGVVYEAEDTSLDRRVALKVMRWRAADGDVARERFVREAKAAAAVRHDHIVTIYQVGEDRGVPFIALEFLKGVPLDAWLKDHPRPPVAHAVRIARQVADGLAAAHGRGLIHRDVKPANVWLEAPKGRVKLLDFGLARPTGDAHLTEEGAVVGTPAYMSPEQARGARVDARTDLWSVGVLLYRMCAGEPPFAGPNVLAVLTALAVDAPAPVRAKNADVPPELADLIDRLLSKDPAGRPPSAAAVAAELRRIETKLSRPAVGGPGSMADVPSTPPVEPHPADPARRRWVRPLAGAAVLLTVVAVAVAAWPRRDPPAPPPGPPVEPAAKAGPPAQPVTVDLLARIEPPPAGGPGTWTRGPDGLTADSQNGYSTATLPHRAPPEYDLDLEYTAAGASAFVSVGVPLPTGRVCQCFLGAGADNRRYGFEAVNGATGTGPTNPSARDGPPRLAGRRVVARIEVRRAGVRTLVDGQVAAEWADLSQLAWGGATGDRPQLTLFRGPVVFHAARLTDLGGRGETVRPAADPPPRPVELLDRMMPADTNAKGPWTRAPNGLVLNSPGTFTSPVIPYRLPPEYDLAIEFTTPATNGEFSFMTYDLPLPTGQLCVCHVGAPPSSGGVNNRYALERVGGLAPGEKDPTFRTGPPRVVGRRMASRVEVRRSGVRVLMDGVVALDYADLGRLSRDNNTSRITRITLLGGPILFHAISITDVSGRGEVIPPAVKKP